MMRIYILIVALCCLQVQRCASANVSKMLELTRETLGERMLSGRILFVYFGKQGKNGFICTLTQSLHYINHSNPANSSLHVFDNIHVLRRELM